MNKEFPYKDIVEYCTQQAPKEACGLVVLFKGRYVWIPCPNTSPSPEEEFAISPVDFADAEDMGDIIAIVHSHPKGGASPSLADRASQALHGIDWLIVGLKGDVENEIFWLKGDKRIPPLYGRTYLWHVQDCGSFIKDFYAQEYGIEVTEYYREENFWEKGIQPYLDNYVKLGFVEIDKREMMEGDVLLMQIGATSVATHAAVYIGDNKIAHHITGRLSCREVYGQYYQDRTVKAIRHKDRMND